MTILLASQPDEPSALPSSYTAAYSTSCPGLMLFPVQIAILITDGKSQDSVQRPAQKLRGQGVVVFAVGRRLPVAEELQL